MSYNLRTDATWKLLTENIYVKPKAMGRGRCTLPFLKSMHFTSISLLLLEVWLSRLGLCEPSLP